MKQEQQPLKKDQLDSKNKLLYWPCVGNLKDG